MGPPRLLRGARTARVASCALALAILGVVTPLQGWTQAPHRQINAEAVAAFFARMEREPSEKFRLGPVPTDERKALHRGIAVTSSTMFVKPSGGLAEAYEIGEARHSMPAWISLGGDWADEPHLYASVRHFYDPLQVAGVPFLTDQLWAHGAYDSPGIEAVTWALDHPDNPFSLRQGLVAYKFAMETPEDVPPPPGLGASHFKTNVSLVPGNAAEQRSLYLARAYRALGEAMHMIGDMTQPAHVRNDSHPMDEPIESAVTTSDVRLAAASPAIDAALRPYLSSAGGMLQAPRALSRQVALFTNRTFYSMDTIFDRRTGTLPTNGMPPYPSPQFGDLVVRSATVRGFVGKRDVKKLFGRVAGREVPMAQERLSFHWFDPDHSVVFGPGLETASGFTSKVGPYMIPQAFAREQAAVLLPIAIHACADLMDLFFPTLELKAEYRLEGSGPDGASRRQVVRIEPGMLHHRERDPAWSAFDLDVAYTGPGALVITRGGKVEATRKLHFRKGLLDTIENVAGKMVKAPLRVFVSDGRSALTGEEELYSFAHGQKLHVEIDAGSRHFESPPYELRHEVVIQPRRGVGPPGATFDFEAHARPEGVYRFEWSWPGAGEVVATEGSTSKVAPVLVREGEYPFTVKLVHPDGTVLAEDRATAAVEKETAAPPTPVAKKGPGRWVLVRQWNDVWKDPRVTSSRATAEAGVNSAKIHVTVPDRQTTWQFDYAMSWSPLPASVGRDETFDVTLRLDSIRVPEPRVGWGAEIAVSTGRTEAIRGTAPPKAANFVSQTTWNGSVLQGGLGSAARKPPDSRSVTLDLGWRSPEDGDVQVVTVRTWGQGAGSGGNGAAIHFHYEYRFQE